MLASLMASVDIPLDSWKVGSSVDRMMDVVQALEAFASFVAVGRMGKHMAKDIGMDMGVVP